MDSYEAAYYSELVKDQAAQNAQPEIDALTASISRKKLALYIGGSLAALFFLFKK